MTYLSEVWVGVESTLVTHGGLTLSAGVVVGYSRWVGELCGGAHRAQFAARHGCDLWHRVGRGGCHTAVRRRRGRAACPGAAEVDLEVSTGGVLTRTLTYVASHAGPSWSLTHSVARPLARLHVSGGTWTFVSGQAVRLSRSGTYPSTGAHA